MPRIGLSKQLAGRDIRFVCRARGANGGVADQKERSSFSEIVIGKPVEKRLIPETTHPFVN